MRIALVLTNDWELYGDGSGDYFAVQDRPLRAMLDTLAEHGARVTIMAELGQQWAHRRLAGREDFAARIAAAWEQALLDAVRRGHDVQMHIHPQWLTAEWSGTEWRLAERDLAIAALGAERMVRLLRDGKSYLETLIGAADPSYRCIAFRAGAFCVEPWPVYASGLRAAGIRVDSSIAKGLHHPGFFDFRGARSSTAPWRLHPGGLAATDEAIGAVLELPISTRRGAPPMLRRLLAPALHHRLAFGVRPAEADLAWQARNRALVAERYPPARRIAVTGQRPKAWLGRGGRLSPRSLRRLFAREWLPLDYDNLPAAVFVRCLADLLRDGATGRFGDRPILPVVAIGHVKTMCDTGNLDRILHQVANELGDQVAFWTLREAAAACGAAEPSAAP